MAPHHPTAGTPPTTQLVVGLSPALADALLTGRRTTVTDELVRVIDQARVTLRPQGVRSTASTEEATDVWFATEADVTAAQELAAALLDVPGVTAAYLKPSDSTP